MTVRRSVILGCGSYLPSRVVTNADLATKVDTSDEWIVQRTGIHERRIAAPGEVTSQLAAQAARAALAHAHVDAQSVDLIVLATSTPDNTFPASAVSVQAELGITHGAAFDLQAVCSGFVYALATADGLLRSGAFNRALVIGAETFSRLLDWTYRGTCVLFGDGAGAVVLQATKGDHGILGSSMKSNGNYSDFICMPGGGSNRPANDVKSIEEKLPYIKMKGNETFKVAVKAMADVSSALLAEQGFTKEDVKVFIPHQANERIIDAVGERMKFPAERVYKNVDRYGNTSAASIPIALDECVRGGIIKTGDLVLMTAFGAGLVWGSVLVRW